MKNEKLRMKNDIDFPNLILKRKVTSFKNDIDFPSPSLEEEGEASYY
jgi:hypothetical protein